MSPELHINLVNLQSNIRYFRGVIKRNVELSAVVKSNAYGLGITKLVPVIESYGISSFFTATLSEAIKVRKCSPHSEIFTLNGFDFRAQSLFSANVAIHRCKTRFHYEFLTNFDEILTNFDEILTNGDEF